MQPNLDGCFCSVFQELFEEHGGKKRTVQLLLGSLGHCFFDALSIVWEHLMILLFTWFTDIWYPSLISIISFQNKLYIYDLCSWCKQAMRRKDFILKRLVIVGLSCVSVMLIPFWFNKVLPWTLRYLHESHESITGHSF